MKSARKIDDSKPFLVKKLPVSNTSGKIMTPRIICPEKSQRAKYIQESHDYFHVYTFARPRKFWPVPVYMLVFVYLFSFL